MIHRRQLMKKISILFLLILLTFSIAFSNSYEVVYSGSIEGKTIKAISVDRIYEEQELNELVGPLNGQNVIVLVYKDYKLYNSLEPLAVYDDVKKSYNPKFKSSTSYPTIQDKINSATYRTRVGAICRDGTRSSATGRGACSHHGGVSRWLYKETKKTNATIASICKNYYLEAESYNNCSKNNGILVQIKNRSYK